MAPHKKPPLKKSSANPAVKVTLKPPLKAGSGKNGAKTKAQARPAPAKAVTKKPVANLTAKAKAVPANKGDANKKTAAKAAVPPKPMLTTAQRERAGALQAAAKRAESFVDKPSKKELTPAQEKRARALQKPVNPAEAARAIKQIKASLFSSLAATPAVRSADSSLSPRLQALLDKQEIVDVMYSYARGVDRGEESLVRSAFHPDAWIDYGPSIFEGGLPDFINWLMEVRGGIKAVQHFITNSRADLRGDVALVETYFLAWHRLEKATGKEDFFIGGRYLDRLERRPGGTGGVWKITARKQVKDWTRTMPVAELFYHLNPDALWAKPGKQDESYHMEQFATPGTATKAATFGSRRYDAKSIKL